MYQSTTTSPKLSCKNSRVKPRNDGFNSFIPHLFLFNHLLFVYIQDQDNLSLRILNLLLPLQTHSLPFLHQQINEQRLSENTSLYINIWYSLTEMKVLLLNIASHKYASYTMCDQLHPDYDQTIMSWYTHNQLV